MHELSHALQHRTTRRTPDGALVAGGDSGDEHGAEFIYAATRVARLLRLPESTPAGAAYWPRL